MAAIESASFWGQGTAAEQAAYLDHSPCVIQGWCRRGYPARTLRRMSAPLRVEVMVRASDRLFSGVV
jgi:hypothetical protein